MDFSQLAGRISGRSHTIEIWFALNEQTLYLLSGGMDRSDWVKNAWREPHVTVRVADTILAGNARPVKSPEEETLARQLIGAKYREEEDLDEWLRQAFK